MKTLFLFLFLLLGLHAGAQTGIALYGDAGTVHDGDIFYDVQGFTGSNTGTDKYVTALELKGYIGSAFQPLSSNLSLWSAVAPASYETTSAAAAAFQPSNSNLTLWSAVAPSSYETTAAAAAAFAPISGSSNYDAAGAAATAQGNSLQKAQNLADLANVTTARNNLGLGTGAPNSASGAVVSNGSNVIAQNTSGNAATSTTAGSVLFTGVTSRPVLDPSNIMPGITAWFDPAKLDLADGTAVSSVPDALGSGATLAQATSANQPVYKVTGINGQPSLLFNGTANYLLSSFSLDSTYNHAFTLVAVVQSNNTTIQGFAASIDYQFEAALYNWNNGFVAFDIGGNLIGSYGASIANYTGPMVIVMSYDGTTARTFVNGVESFEQPTTVNMAAAAVMQVGLIGGAYPFSGFIRDIVVYKHGGSVDEDSALSKWFLEHRGFSRHQIIWNGDSLTQGEAATANGGLPYVSTALLGQSALQWTACNTGWYGQTLYTEIGDAGNRMYPGVIPSYDPIAVVWFGTNDAALGAATASTIYANTQAYCQHLQSLGYKVVVVTMLPRGDSAQAAGFETARKAFNASMVSGWTGFADGIADLGDDPTIGVFGAPSNTTYYNADKIHLLNAGYLIAAPTMANAIKHALHQPVFINGTLASGACTINDPDIVPGIVPGAPVHLWSSGTNAGTLSIYSCTQPTGGAPGQIVVHSSNSSDNDTFKIQLQ